MEVLKVFWVITAKDLFSKTPLRNELQINHRSYGLPMIFFIFVPEIEPRGA